MDKILRMFDSSTFLKESTRNFDPIRILTQCREQRENLFFGTQFQKVNVSSRVPNNVKVKTICESLRCHLVKNMIYCLHKGPAEVLKLQSFIADLKLLCPEKELNNEDKLAMLNIYFAEIYTMNSAPSSTILSEIRLLSYQLAQLDLMTPEPYFYYMITHWPNEDHDKDSNTEYLETYDEELLWNSVQKMRNIQEKRTVFLKHERSPLHRPFCFLAMGAGLSRLDIVPDGHGGRYNQKIRNNRRKILVGRKSHRNDKRYITYVLPRGKEIEVGIWNNRWLKSTSAVSEFSFELGFSLKGPIALYYKEISVEDEKLHQYNNA